MKTCLREPVPEIYEAADLLNQAAEEHLSGNFKAAEELILKADMPLVREWTESIWGSGGIYSQLKKELGKPNVLPKELRHGLRMPDKSGESELLKRDGHYCRFCGIPVIRKELRVFLNKHYPDALKWGKTNFDQHAAFQAMWVQYDHLVPHARGGKTDHENMVITCAPCNYGRMNYLVNEIGLTLPELNLNRSFNWDGLERLLNKNK